MMSIVKHKLHRHSAQHNLQADNTKTNTTQSHGITTQSRNSMLWYTNRSTIGKGSQIAAKAGVSKTFPPGKIWAGFPIREIDTWRKEVSMLRRASKDKKNDKK